MIHFGEIIEYIEDDPLNLMIPSDLTKTLSILNYRPPKFQSYEKLTSITQRNRQNFNTKTTYLRPKHFTYNCQKNTNTKPSEIDLTKTLTHNTTIFTTQTQGKRLIPDPIIFIGRKGSLDLASPRSFHFFVSPKKYSVGNGLKFP